MEGTVQKQSIPFEFADVPSRLGETSPPSGTPLFHRSRCQKNWTVFHLSSIIS